VNQKAVYSIVIVVAIVFGVLKTVPLVPVTEDLISQTFTIGGGGTAITTFFAKKGWTVSGGYSSNSSNCKYFLTECTPQFRINSPDGQTIVYEQSGALSGRFSFSAEEGGSYKVEIFNGFGGTVMTVTLEATQTGKITII